MARRCNLEASRDEGASAAGAAANSGAMLSTSGDTARRKAVDVMTPSGQWEGNAVGKVRGCANCERSEQLLTKTCEAERGLGADFSQKA